MYIVILYGLLGVCLLVSMIVFEYVQIFYILNNVILVKGEYKCLEYLVVNFKGKVLVLNLNGWVIMEILVIFIVLNSIWL